MLFGWEMVWSVVAGLGGCCLGWWFRQLVVYLCNYLVGWLV